MFDKDNLITRIIGVTLLSGSIAVTGCQTTESAEGDSSDQMADTSQLADASQSDALSGEEVRELLVGNTLSGSSSYSGTPYDYYEYYNPNGDLEGSWRNNTVQKSETYSGTYEVRDGRFCSNDWCYRLKEIGNGKYELVDSNDDSSEVRVLEGRHEYD